MGSLLLFLLGCGVWVLGCPLVVYCSGRLPGWVAVVVAIWWGLVGLQGFYSSWGDK